MRMLPRSLVSWVTLGVITVAVSACASIGTDPLIHGGRPEGLLQVLADVFDRPGIPRVPLEPIFDLLRRQAPTLSRRYGGLYTRGAFAELVWSATDLAARFRQA